MRWGKGEGGSRACPSHTRPNFTRPPAFAEDPWRPIKNMDPTAKLHDGMTLLEWADKLSRRGEVDLWAYAAPEE